MPNTSIAMSRIVAIATLLPSLALAQAKPPATGHEGWREWIITRPPPPMHR